VLLPEDAYVFGGTVRANLTYLAPDATTAAVEEAVRLLGADALVARLGGLDAELRPERLSGGERQLLALVRGYLSPAPLVLLDEAGSYLDAAGEGRVEAAFAARPGALVVIAHRISSALRAQRVLVMDGPSIAVGTHDELLTRSPLYRDLVGGWGGPPDPAVRSGPCASSSPAAPSNTPAA
jgi:ATP-binding cassette subfamily C protein